MLPPIEDSVLQQNPDFAALHKTLSTSILHQDGSTKNDPSAKERDAVQEKLRAHRLKAAKRHLLIRALSTATPPEPKAAALGSIKPTKTTTMTTTATAATTNQQQLPTELLDLLILLPLILTSPTILSQANTTLLLSNPPLSNLPDLLPDLGLLTSSVLRTSASSLARIANPNTNPSYLHRAIPQLASHIVDQQKHLREHTLALSEARHATATSLLRLLDAHAAALASLTRTLESKHGPISRSLELRAADLSLEAQTVEADVQAALWAVRKEVYAPEARAALRNYAVHLRDGKMRLGEAIRTAEGELVEYGVGKEGKERAMREMARVFREMKTEMSDAKRDLDRLGGSRA